MKVTSLVGSNVHGLQFFPSEVPPKSNERQESTQKPAEKPQTAKVAEEEVSFD